MALSSGFFTSSNGDRVYTADQLGGIFDGIIGNGVFATVPNFFMVTTSTATPSQTGYLPITVKSGKAWFDHVWVVNDADVVVELEPRSVQTRIDTVTLEINKDRAVRAARIVVVKGTPSATPVAPTWTDTATVHKYPLAHIAVAADVTTIGPGDIFNLIGTAACPWVTGALVTVTTNDLINQWSAQWEELKSVKSTTFDQMQAAKGSSFDTWYANVRSVFSETEYQNIMNRVASVNEIFWASFPASGWFETEPGSTIYACQASVPGMSSAYNPILVSGIAPDASAYDVRVYNRNFNIMAGGRGNTGDGVVWWFCYGSKPDIDMLVGFKGE